SYRKHQTAAIQANGAELIPGIRQIWTLQEEYSNEKFQHPPVLSIESDQALRITFHRGAGGILQDLEIPPHENVVEIEVPPGTKSFTAEGLGGKHLNYDNINIGSSSISSKFSSQTFPAIGFQRLSTIHQIGLYRYLGRGCYIQSQESASKRTMEETSSFCAGEVLAKIDNIRFYCGSSFQTLVAIVRTLPEEVPNIKVAMEGVTPMKDPLAIKRMDAVAYIWQVQAIEGFEGPAIIDILTDETTDVNSLMAFSAHPQNVLELLQEQKWISLVHEGPLSFEGNSKLFWKHTPNEFHQDTKGKELKLNLTMSKTSELSSTTKQAKEFVQPITIPIQPAPITTRPEPNIEVKTHQPHVEISAELPRLPPTVATTGEAFQFDLSTFVGDDDEGDTHTFSFVLAPGWLLITEAGLIAGTPSVEDVGIHQCVLRVTDTGGLSSDAVLEIEVKQKILNRAPYWKPNLKIGGESPQAEQKSRVSGLENSNVKIELPSTPEILGKDINSSVHQPLPSKETSLDDRQRTKAKRKRR
ncbi:MAG: putative Ig domain-containing protein, partial [archaeon]|nr:putative Ig domain-containing protein [archaeon]